ncbi:MAG: tRNA guanosine(34) transglycosylase Tgt [Candidatus Berkelbacteria bacterium]|nr:MAG: tRNA guanosine(34) transglycosylase Tgt [Candidatus Berkelbacteria bacterium]QQG51427.1 MAG: tRNA guanosine(34) transglycosylase Tgt [Candidatus Berkelbacteria bacterium]
MFFKVLHKQKNSLARTGELVTPHGIIQTPVFMPVATSGAVKTLFPWEVQELGAEIILGNTYHLHLRPGAGHIAEAGGFAKWTQWNGPVLTDSGGYQAYSLGATRAKTAKTTNDGVRFYSHLDGGKHEFTPESVLDIQRKLGSDIVMPLDDCPPIEATEKRVQSAVIRTTNWARRSTDYWQQQKMGESGRGLFGIIQGGLFEDLRLQSTREIQDLPFDGIAVGGVAIASEGKDKINKAVDYVANHLDPSRPHYLMGIGYPEDIIRMVARGFDMFDCVLPTRLARHGVFWTEALGQFNIMNSSFRNDRSPLDTECGCRMCKTFTRDYLRHLYATGETLAGRALSYHNLWVILRLMERVRSCIKEGNFDVEFQSVLNAPR